MKRICDIAISVGVIIGLLPFIVLVAIMIRIKLGRPILFKQQRPGLHQQPFALYKFRTMTLATDDDGQLLPDHLRLTSFGKWLRKYSIDELPQLINVCKGDLSLVGPRPLLMAYLPLYTQEQAIRHQVKPGLTGWAQVNGRNSLTWEEKFELDAWYVQHQSFSLDLKILILTISCLFRPGDVKHQDHVTMPTFKGSVR